MKKNLYMLLLGCKPHDRYTEQHDVFFGIGESLQDLIPSIIAFWPEAEGKIHIDAWRHVAVVDGYQITVASSENTSPRTEGHSATLFPESWRL